MKSKKLLKMASLLAVSSISLNANAQMVGGDVFLKGTYVEVGIGHLGYYGSDAAAPSGYHPHGSTKVGFVADPLMTGWGTGSTSHYMGDYFLPGSPFEGWVLQVGSDRCQGYNSGSSSSSLTTTGPTCTGSNLSYSTSGTTVIGTWQGVFDSVEITQITTLDTNQQYFTVKVILTNTAVAPKNDLYYLRSLDPDNDQSWPGGGFPTNNLVEYQSTDTTIVSAAGLSTGSPYMALGTTDTAATAIIYNMWPIPLVNDLDSAYNATMSAAFFTPGTVHMGDIAIGLTMYIPHLATVDSAGDSVYRTTASAALHPANTATLNYFYAFSADGRDSAIAYLNRTATLPSTLGIKNVNNNEIVVYPNPSRDMVNVSNLVSTDRITLYDMMGRSVNQNWVISNNGTNIFRYENVPMGTYVLIVTDATGSVKARVPVKKQ